MDQEEEEAMDEEVEKEEEGGEGVDPTVLGDLHHTVSINLENPLLNHILFANLPLSIILPHSQLLFQQLLRRLTSEVLKQYLCFLM